MKLQEFFESMGIDIDATKYLKENQIIHFGIITSMRDNSSETNQNKQKKQ